MLRLQARVLAGFSVAAMILMLLVYQKGPALDRGLKIGLQFEQNGKSKEQSLATTVDGHRSKKGETTLLPAIKQTDEADFILGSLPHAGHADNLPLQVSIDWTRYAYVQYSTDAEYVCNAVMVFATLHKLGSQADRVLMYPRYMLDDQIMRSFESRKLLLKARDEYGVKLVPVEIQHRQNSEATWANSYTKLLVFNQTHYERVIAFDSDALVLQHMDELFLMPRCPIAMPRAYWLMTEEPPKTMFSTHIMLVQPSESEFKRVQALIRKANDGDFDMEIINKLYGLSAAILPHRPYALLTAEFRSETHEIYLGSDVQVWDPRAILDETKLIHFSDWPVPKPWVDTKDGRGLRIKHQPDCNSDIDQRCLDRDIWNSLYAKFAQLRKVMALSS